VSTPPSLPHPSHIFIRLWLAGAGSIFVYVPLFLLLRGHIVLANNDPNDIRAPGLYLFPAVDEGEEEADIRRRKDAYKLLLYPAAYTTLVLPLSVVRWMVFSNAGLADPQLPWMRPLASATLIFHALFRLSGVINVVLILTTRPNVLLCGREIIEDMGGHGGDVPLQPMNEGRGNNAGMYAQQGNAAQPME
jgi:hypothetical protein